MNINMTPDLEAALRVRLSNEFGATSAANFALSIIAESQEAEIKRLSELNEGMGMSNRALKADLDAVRAERDALKTHKGRGAAKAE
jgi:hypothetical protein